MTAGQLVGLGLQIVMQRNLSDAALHSWGWRIPFIVGALGAAVVFYLRRSMLETEVYEESGAARDEDRGTLKALWRHKREALLVMALTMGGTVAYYTYTTYLTKFLSKSAGMDKSTASLVSFCALFVFMCLQPLAGALSDRIGRRPLLITFAIGSTFLTVPIMTMLKHAGTFWPAFGLALLALVVVTGYTSINACVKAELFPTGIRALGVGPAVRHRERAVRRDGRVRGALVQAGGHRVRLLLVRRRVRGGVPGRLPQHARDA